MERGYPPRLHETIPFTRRPRGVRGHADDTRRAGGHDAPARAVRRRGRYDGLSLFADAPGLEWVFLKRALHSNAAIGYHEQGHDEICYVLSGTGELTMNGSTSMVGPGMAILTRTGSSHGFRQIGEEDLVSLIVYRQEGL
ncbi:cupin domain-containing protein [Rubrivirga marina]|uniref:Cupin type-2 domain-containing protein n=1 Tax=Rubrivirga marina TaxID=1196024 RepID=A0A271J2N8_9BACT|nr:hypothetical protein BSZ37_15565 [Rubrivirga marina]